VVTPSSTTFTRGLESNSTATGILIFSELHGYATQQLSGHAASRQRASRFDKREFAMIVAGCTFV
jgi:hypothetical protein